MKSAKFLALMLLAWPLIRAQASLEEASAHPRWLRLYQYRADGAGFRSDVNSDRFFFSADGPRDPLAEMRAAVEAYEKQKSPWGTLKLSAACAFPARKKVLEDLLKRKFPSEACPELKTWLERVNADRTSLVFVGAYSGNAASILGHTFLRLSNSSRESSGREGMDLLSHSVGYTAHADPDDGRLSYMLKGLTGAYPGFYDIEPYYMKVGLYNNSESRDLWDVRLNLSAEETRFLSELIWEYTFNAQTEYYFIGKNCSYRLLKLLEAVRPGLDVSESFSFAVLPAETVRVLIDAGLTTKESRFRSSIKRRLNLKRALLTGAQEKEFHGAVRSVEAARRISDPTLADALLDYWLFENYQVQTRLPEAKKEIMEATFQRASEIPGVSRFQKSDEDVRREGKLSPPFEGHRPRWIETEAGSFREKFSAGFSGRLGVHPSWSADPSYREISAIEYLGIDYRAQEVEPDRWKFLFLRAQTLEEFFGGQRNPSWGFDIQISNDCKLCGNDEATLQISGSYGLSTRRGPFLIALLPDLRGAVSREESLLAPGFRSLLRWDGERNLISFESASSWWKARKRTDFEARWGYLLSRDRQIFLKVREASVLTSFVLFF